MGKKIDYTWGRGRAGNGRVGRSTGLATKAGRKGMGSNWREAIQREGAQDGEE